MDELREALLKFRNDRDWEQFHNAKDLALALNVEAGELLEGRQHFYNIKNNE